MQSSTKKQNKKKTGQVVKFNNKTVEEVVTPAEEGKRTPTQTTTPSAKNTVSKPTTTPNENKPPKISVESELSSKRLLKQGKEEINNVTKNVSKSPAIAGLASALDQSFDSTTSSTSSKKNVRFSHKDIMKIPAITKKMKETQKTSADFGVPTKGLLKKTSSSSLTPASAKSSTKRKQ
jgi:hypothetical protein